MKKAKRILLVDDDVDDQMYFRDAVSEVSPSLQCEIANNGSEALQQIAVPPPPDLIFMDLNMPVMNGYECLVTLRKMEQYKDIPIIIFTTSNNSHDIAQAKRLGAALYFTKPADFKMLCNKLDRILDLDFSRFNFVL